MPNPVDQAPLKIDGQLSNDLTTQNAPPQSTTPAAEFGSEAWYAARWESYTAVGQVFLSNRKRVK